MIVVHGTWEPAASGAPQGRFICWGEQAPPSRRRGRRSSAPKAAPPDHPFLAAPPDVRDALALASGGSVSATIPARIVSFVACLPGSDSLPQASPHLPLPQDPPPEGWSLRPWTIRGIELAPTVAAHLLAALPLAPSGESFGTRERTALGDDLRFWIAATQLALELLARQRLLPALVPTATGNLRAGWIPLLDERRDAERVALLAEAMPPVCRALAPHPSPRELLLDFLGALVDELPRHWLATIPYRVPAGGHTRSAAERWAEALRAGQAEVAASEFDLQRLQRALESWTAPLLEASAPAAFRTCFRLSPPEADETAASQARAAGARDAPTAFLSQEERSTPPAQPSALSTQHSVLPPQPSSSWTLEFLLQASDDPSLLVPASVVWREAGATLRYLDRRFARPQERLLADLARAAQIFPPLEAALRSPRPERCALTTAEAYQFLREAAELLEQSGFGVLVPSWWGKGKRLGVRLTLRPRQPAEPSARGEGGAGMGAGAIVDFDWRIALGDQVLDPSEFERLTQLKVPLVQVRGEWVELRPEEVERAIAAWELRQRRGGVPMGEAVRLLLGGPEEAGAGVVDVRADGWLAELAERLRAGAHDRAAGVQRLATPKQFVGKLRPYQVRGFSWLAFMRRWGLGACLADDMGLGKTPQTLALLLHERAQGWARGPTLLICPTSVVGNWQREAARFAPSLRVLVHHGPGRADGERFVEEARAHDLVISSYALLSRDEARLAAVDWEGVVLDEAQNVKNSSTRQAQAARRLRARYRIALTGTPVENRLAELWAIMEFLNPGYLGSQESFRRHFALPIERWQDKERTRALRRIVQPFILRRVKSDPRIIRDLPEKLEMKVYCQLTPEQATLYEAVVREMLAQIEAAEGMQRRGLVLSTLMRLKQVCNHPAHYLDDGSALAGQAGPRSGKLARLEEMLEEALAEGDRALIFTQFARFGQRLREYLAERFGREVLFLHGEVPASVRDAMVARFQERNGPPLFVLSLRAGGVGLNLTAANHVFHFDRWWNPAVENQATDRAYRIGQQRTVQVHKLLCVGTLEERIDNLIESKQALAEQVVGSGEAWLTELSTAELRDLLTLRREAVAEE